MEILEQGNYYHIFNRGNNSENIFRNEGNRLYFLKLYNKYLSNIVTTFAYCLLNNHFHFVIRVDRENREVTQAFSNFFNAYAKAFNKANHRTGSLFEKNFRRISIDNEPYLKNLILYVHFNPQIHFGIKYSGYQFSSFQPIIKGDNATVNISETIELFEDLENLKRHHENQDLILEEKFKLE